MVASNGNGNGNHVDGPPKPRKKTRPAIDQRFIDPGRVIDQPARLPGWEGTPFRGDAPFLRESDQVQPQIGYSSYTDVFVMNDEEDVEYYNAVYQQAYNNFAIICSDERRWDEDAKTWHIFLRWAIPYSYIPKDQKEPTNGQVR